MDWVLGVAGLALALYQVRKAERAAVSARNAVIDTSANINAFSFLLLVPELALVERDLENAATLGKKEDTLRLLREWQARASELRGLLTVHEALELQMAEGVQTSIALASTAYSAVSKGKPVAQSTERARKSATEVVLLARSEAERVRATIKPPREISTLKDDLRAVFQRVRPNKAKKELER